MSREIAAFAAAVPDIIDGIATQEYSLMNWETFDREGPGWAPLEKKTQRIRRWLIKAGRVDAAVIGEAHPILQRTQELFFSLTDQDDEGFIHEHRKSGGHLYISFGTAEGVKFDAHQSGVGYMPARPIITQQSGTAMLAKIERRAADALELALRKAQNG